MALGVDGELTPVSTFMKQEAGLHCRLSKEYFIVLRRREYSYTGKSKQKRIFLHRQNILTQAKSKLIIDAG